MRASRRVSAAHLLTRVCRAYLSNFNHKTTAQSSIDRIPTSNNFSPAERRSYDFFRSEVAHMLSSCFAQSFPNEAGPLLLHPSHVPFVEQSGIPYEALIITALCNNVFQTHSARTPETYARSLPIRISTKSRSSWQPCLHWQLQHQRRELRRMMWQVLQYNHLLARVCS